MVDFGPPLVDVWSGLRHRQPVLQEAESSVEAAIRLREVGEDTLGHRVNAAGRDDICLPRNRLPRHRIEAKCVANLDSIDGSSGRRIVNLTLIHRPAKYVETRLVVFRAASRNLGAENIAQIAAPH